MLTRKTPEQIQSKIDLKTRRRQKKRQTKMAVSGKTVFNLRRVIIQKNLAAKLTKG